MTPEHRGHLGTQRLVLQESASRHLASLGCGGVTTFSWQLRAGVSSRRTTLGLPVLRGSVSQVVPECPSGQAPVR